MAIDMAPERVQDDELKARHRTMWGNGDGPRASWDRGTPGHARFEKEYLLAVGTRQA